MSAGINTPCRKAGGAEGGGGEVPRAGVSGRFEGRRSGRLRRGIAGLAKLRHRQYHREPLPKALGDGLFELRHLGKLNTRVLWFFMKNRRIIAVHGIRNKGQAIPVRDIHTAHERMRDWQERTKP